jgi:WD40 repeat protein
MFPLNFFKVWDLLDGNEITGIELDNKAELVRFSSDARLVIIGCDDKRVVIWEWQNYDGKWVVTLPSSFTTFAEIACEGNIIYTCSRNMKVCQIDLGSLKVSTVRQGPYPNCTPMVVLPDGKVILRGTLEDSGFSRWKLLTNNSFRLVAGR